MPKIFFGNRSHLADNVDVIAKLDELGDDYYVLLEVEVAGVNIDCIVIRPSETDKPSTFTLTEIKHVQGRVRGVENGPWLINRNGIETPMPSSNPSDANPWNQTIRALNSFRDWLALNQMVFRHRDQPADSKDFRVWPMLLLVWSGHENEHHALPLQPSTKFGTFTFSVDQWISYTKSWEPNKGLAFTQEDIESLVRTLNLSPLTDAMKADLIKNQRLTSYAHDDQPVEPIHIPSPDMSLPWARQFVEWAESMTKRVACLEQKLAAAESVVVRPAPRSNGSAPPREDPVVRSLTNEETHALRNAVDYVVQMDKPRSFPNVLAYLNMALGYDLKSRDYNGFLRARAFFDQAVADGLIRYGPEIGPAPSIYMAGEAIPS